MKENLVEVPDDAAARVTLTNLFADFDKLGEFEGREKQLADFEGALKNSVDVVKVLKSGPGGDEREVVFDDVFLSRLQNRVRNEVSNDAVVDFNIMQYAHVPAERNRYFLRFVFGVEGDKKFSYEYECPFRSANNKNDPERVGAFKALPTEHGMGDIRTLGDKPLWQDNGTRFAHHFDYTRILQKAVVDTLCELALERAHIVAPGVIVDKLSKLAVGEVVKIKCEGRTGVIRSISKSAGTATVAGENGRALTYRLEDLQVEPN